MLFKKGACCLKNSFFTRGKSIECNILEKAGFEKRGITPFNCEKVILQGGAENDPASFDPI